MNRFLFTFAILWVIWIGLTSSFNPQELIAGAVVSLIIASFSYKTFSEYGLKFFYPKRIYYIFKYLVVFLIALVKANFDVARRVIDPKLPINPGIVEYKTQLTDNAAKVILADSITLTPGTLTVDIRGDKLYIHWIDVVSKDPEVIYSEIGENFEKVLKEIFQ
jgi:multicomponent Na+:H+ antiporter subunit E